jgi:hypothetical protein
MKRYRTCDRERCKTTPRTQWPPNITGISARVNTRAFEREAADELLTFLVEPDDSRLWPDPHPW